MYNNGEKFISQFDFSEQIPEFLLKSEIPNPIYEKAFLSRTDNSKTEYALNTTAWD